MENAIDPEERLEAVIAEDFVEQASDGRTEETTIFTCPDCGGVLWQGAEGSEGSVLRFRCHVGHAFAPEVLLSQKSEELETALWSSLRLLEREGDADAAACQSHAYLWKWQDGPSGGTDCGTSRAG